MISRPKAWFLYIVIVDNRKQVQTYREQINCESWLKFLSLLAWTRLRLLIVTTIMTKWEQGLKADSHVTGTESEAKVAYKEPTCYCWLLFVTVSRKITDGA